MKKSYLLTPLLFVITSSLGLAKDRWMEQSRFGLMFHYEAFVDHSTESYNRTIDSFDVKGLLGRGPGIDEALNYL